MANELNRYFKQDEDVGVLSITTGQLTIARIPSSSSPDWIVPQALILSIDNYDERIWNYIWRGQEVSVYHLLPKDAQPTHLVVLESVTDIHRLALQIHGEVTFHSVRIADLKDADDATYQAELATHYPDLLTALNAPNDELIESSRAPNLADYSLQHAYIFQPVMLAGELCVVPDLDKLSHFLVDLDS